MTTNLPSGADLPAGAYTLQAKAHDRSGNDQSVYNNFTVVNAPAAPTNLTATAGDMEVLLNWAAPTSGSYDAPTGYKVYRSTTTGGPYTLITTINSAATLSYTDTGLTNGTTCYYIVKAFNSAGEGPGSNQAQATPAPHTVDVTIRTGSAEATGAFTGAGVYSTTGSNQKGEQTTTPNATVSYTVQVTNITNAAATYTVTAGAVPTGWSAHYYLFNEETGLPADLDAPPGTEVTTSVNGAGWPTPSLEPGAHCTLQVDVTPDATLADGTALPLAIYATPASGLPDTVQAKTTRQKYLLGLQYKRPGDADWMPVGTTPIDVIAGDVVAFQIVTASGPVPPEQKDVFNPGWTRGTESYIGNVVWLDFAAPLAGHEDDLTRLTASWGDSVYVDVHVLPAPDEADTP